MNISTAIVLAVVIACICLAIRSFRKKGMCGCKDGCSCSGSCSSTGCAACPLSEDVVNGMAEAVKGGASRS